MTSRREMQARKRIVALADHQFLPNFAASNLMPTRFIFLLLPGVHLLDLAGPDQVISEAIDFGADFSIEYAGIQPEIETSAGLGISRLKHFSELACQPGDFIVIPGARVKYILSPSMLDNRDLFAWLVQAHQRQANLVSICVGAFVLAEAGLLNGRNCTTHFQLVERLRAQYPLAKVE